MPAATQSRLRFGVLGPLVVDRDGTSHPVPAGVRTTLLAALLVNGEEGVSADVLAELLAEAEPDRDDWASSTLRSYVHRLRSTLTEVDPALQVETRPQGYVLVAEGVSTDQEEFEALLDRARQAEAAGDHAGAAEAAGEALDLWRGPAFGAAGTLSRIRPEAARLEELRSAALELRAAALLEDGRDDEVIGELVGAVDRQPLREELRRLLMLALARTDRHVEALRTYEDYRRLLAEEIGTEPSPRLRALEQRIVRQDASLAGPRRTLAGPGRWPLPAELATTTDLVGRTKELEILAEAAAAAVAGARRVVVVSGEAGSGKTHLVATAAETAAADGLLVLHGATDEILRTPLGPFARALRFFREQGGSWADDLVAPWWGELVRLVPEARTGEADDAAADAADVATDPQTEVLRLLDAIAGWLTATAAVTPLVLVLEDLHWAEPPTLLALKRLLEAGDPGGLLVVATVRDPEPDRPALLDDVIQAARRARVLAAEIELSGLDVGEIRALTAALRDDLEPDESFAEAVAEVTAGNPLFVTELVGDLTEARLPSDRVTLPSAGHLVARRLRQVDPAVARVLAEAAVIGTDIPLDLLVASSASDGETVLRSLDGAIDAGLLVHVPDPRQRLRFSHAVVREALVEQLGRADRVAIHRRVAAALLALPAPAQAAHVEDLARHAYEASVIDGPSVALTPIVRAGDHALQQRAYRHAATWYARALDLADRAGVEGRQRFDLLASMGDAQRRAGDPAFKAAILDAAELARAEGDGAGLARAALIGSRGFYRQTAVADRQWITLLEEAVAAAEDGPAATRALLLASLASELVWDDRGGRRFGLSDEAVALARASGDRAVLSQVLVLRLTTVWSPDRLADCQATAAEAIALTEEVGDRALRCHALRFAAGTALEAGDREASQRFHAQAEDLTDQVAQPDLHWHLSLARASRSVLDGDLVGGREEAFVALRAGQAAGEPEALAFFGAVDLEIRRVEGTLAEIMDAVVEQAELLPEDPAYGLLRHLAEGGHEARAHTEYRRAVAGLDGIAEGMHTLAALSNLAFLASRFADVESAPALYERLAPYADRHPQAIAILPVGHHHLGLLAALMGDGARAEDHFAAAVEAHQRFGAPLHEAETHLEWGRHLSRQEPERRPDATHHLVLARRLAEAHGAHALVEP